MSKRYVSPDQISIEREFDLVRSGWDFPANFNAAPSQAVPVIRVLEGQPDPVLLTWGFGGLESANLPVEALRLGPEEHGRLAEGQRCVMPAMGFYEWRAAPDGSRQPFYIHAEDQDVFGFAGFWERECCTFITLPASPMLAQLNNVDLRMPVILSREMREVWLYGSTAGAAAALVPYPSERLVAYRVSGRVDSLDNNDESLIEPLETNVD
jgi:putative SOS response-associated peptidase YedK